jgi:phenylalanyl-tRNA synthetase alpha chain
VFRNEAIDYKHLAEFHQVEGIVAWKDANLRQLLWVLKEFYRRLGFEEIRFRPSYFPYTEPSLEIEVWFDERKQWIELGGAGIFRKQVVEPLGAEYPVLAFGLSLERPLMLMLGLDDIRTFYTNEIEFLDKTYLW